MLDENDVKVLEKMFERQEQRFEQKIDHKIDGLRSEIHQEFKSVRSEMVRGFSDVQEEFVKVRTEMAQGFKTVRDDIIDVIEQNILPQFTSLNARVTRLERRIA